MDTGRAEADRCVTAGRAVTEGLEPLFNCPLTGPSLDVCKVPPMPRGIRPVSRTYPQKKSSCLRLPCPVEAASSPKY